MKEVSFVETSAKYISVYINNEPIGRYTPNNNLINVTFIPNNEDYIFFSCSNYHEAVDWLIKQSNHQYIYNTPIDRLRLKECPFCGNDARNPYTNDPSGYFWYIGCPICLVKMEGRSILGLIHRWNTRVEQK